MDPMEAQWRWHHWTVSGTADGISKLLNVLDANLPAGWKRLTGSELLPFESLEQPGAPWYALGATASHPEVTLSLRRCFELELRGGAVWFGPLPRTTLPSNLPAAWDQVMRFREEGVVPAARAAGVEIRMPTRLEGFLDELFFDVRHRLQTFSKTARKSLPLTRQEAELWHEFVIIAYRTTTVIDEELFIDWLVAEGWPREAAVELQLRFIDHCLLLSRYVDEVSAA